MRNVYDFSKARKNPYLTQLKKSITIRLYKDSVGCFKAIPEEIGIPYQTLIKLKMNLIAKLKLWATSLKQKIVMLWFATKNPQTPWLPKVICIFIVAYALSPIDLIPDFIPILGFVDEIILLPILIWVAIKLIPQSILDDSLDQARAWATQNQSKPKSLLGLLVVVIIWVLMIWLVYQLI